MSELTTLGFGERGSPRTGFERRVAIRALLGAVAVHLVLLGVLIWSARHPPVRMGTDARQEGMPAFVNPAPRVVGTAGRPTPPAKRVAPRQASQEEPARAVEQSGAIATEPFAAPGGPVRLTPGQRLALLKKVEPIYPPTLHAAGIEGMVVFDAVIRRDGTIGDITVLTSTNLAFEHSAVAAVRQWRYTQIPYDGLLTVTVNFTMRGT